MNFAQTKILWGFVEKESVRVANYKIVVIRDKHRLEVTTNANGFYQFNLGNIPVGIFDGETVYVEAIGDSNFYGESAVVLVNGTSTQQVLTIQVQEDPSLPSLENINPVLYDNTPYPISDIDIMDLGSGPDVDSLNLNFNSLILMQNGVQLSDDFVISYDFLSRHRVIISVTNKNPLPDGSSCNLSGSIGDRTGNILNFSNAFLIDLTPPRIVSLSPSKNAVVLNHNTPIEIEIVDDLSSVDPSSIELLVNDVSYTVSSPDLTFVSNVIQFSPSIPYVETTIVRWSLTSKDFADNEIDPICSCFAVMSKRPDFTHPSPTPDSFDNVREPIISALIYKGSNDLDLLSFWLTINSIAIANDDPRLTIDQDGFTFTPDSDFGDTVHVEASIKDVLGLESRIAWNFSIDTAPPIILPEYPLQNSFVRSSMSVLSVKITDNNSGIDLNSIILNINGTSFVFPCEQLNFSGNILSFIPQTHYLVNNVLIVRASDNAENQASPLILNFGVDSDSPNVISVDPSSSTNDLQPTIYIKVEDVQSGIDPLSIVVTINGQQSLDVTFDGHTISAKSPSQFNQNDIVTVHLFIQDNIGNVFNNVVSTFFIDAVPLNVIEIDPMSGQYIGIDPHTWKVKFNKRVDLSNAQFGRDIILKTHPASNAGPFIDVSGTSNIDSFSSDTLVVIPEIGFVPGTAYKIFLSNRIKDFAGNLLNGLNPIGTIVFESEFTYYQPGDLLVRGEIGVSDLVKYLKIVSGCDDKIVTPLPELADLNGDGVIDYQDSLIIESIILGNMTPDDIIVSGTRPITNLFVPIQDGNVPEIRMSGFLTKPIGDRASGIISIPNAVNIVGLQCDITYDPSVLFLIDVYPILSFDVFRYTQIAPNKIRLIFVDLGANLTNDLAEFAFRVIGKPSSPIDISSVEIMSKGEALLTPSLITSGFFVTDLVDSLIISILVEPDQNMIPADVRETFVYATLIGYGGVPIHAESVPLEWFVIGNGFVSQNLTISDQTGKSKNLLRLSGPVNSSVQVKVQEKYNESIDGISPVIKLIDSRVIGLCIKTIPEGITMIGTGEPLCFQAFAETIDHLVTKTKNVMWEVEQSDAVISSDGEFTSFKPGNYRVTATLKTRHCIVAKSEIIRVVSIMEFTDCNDMPILTDSISGFPKIGLGHVFAGNKTGTQEVHIRNTSPFWVYPMIHDSLLNLQIELLHLDLKTQFSPIVENIEIRKRSIQGNIQIISLKDGYHEMLLPNLEISHTTNGIAMIFLDHVNITNIGLFNCKQNFGSCHRIREVFDKQKTNLNDLVDDGDFFVDEKLGRIYVKISFDISFTGRVMYKYIKSVTVSNLEGNVLLVNEILDDQDEVFASYSFRTGKLENIVISISSDADISISLDGVLFAKSITIRSLQPQGISRFYVRANSSFNESVGLRFGEITVEADSVSVGGCY